MTVRNMVKLMFSDDGHTFVNEGLYIDVYSGGFMVARINPDTEQYDTKRGIYAGFDVDIFWDKTRSEIMGAQVKGIESDRYEFRMYLD